MKKNKIKLTIFFVILIIGAGFLIWFTTGWENNSEKKDTNLGELKPMRILSGPYVDAPPKPEDLTQSYTDTGGDFSFKYEEGMKATQNIVEGGEIITVEKDPEHGFQVFTMPLEERGPLTKERIMLDLPDIFIENDRPARLDGVEVLTFNSENEIGETFEVWAIKNGKLYQIISPRNQEKWLIGVLETWVWK